MAHLLEIRNLTVEFPTARGRCVPSTASTSIVDAGEVVGIVGEIGLGQERADARGDGPAAAGPAGSRADRLRVRRAAICCGLARGSAGAAASARTSR